VAAVALQAGKRSVPRYSHPNSRRDVSLCQLLALLVLRQFCKTDYRGIVEILGDWPALQDDLNLSKVCALHDIAESRSQAVQRRSGASADRPDRRARPLKQRQGEALTARKHHTRRREMALRCIAHDIMIVYANGAFLRGIPGTAFSPRNVNTPACREVRWGVFGDLHGHTSASK
jgi:hypothetical protein